MTCAVIDSNKPRLNGLFGRHMPLPTRARTCIYVDPSRTSVYQGRSLLNPLGDHVLKCDTPGRVEAVFGQSHSCSLFLGHIKCHPLTTRIPCTPPPTPELPRNAPPGLASTDSWCRYV